LTSFHEVIFVAFNHHSIQPCITEEWKDDHHQSVVLKSFFEISVEHTRNSPGHSTTGTGYPKHVTDQTDWVTRFKPGSGNKSKNCGKEDIASYLPQ
jgi:hypothetical protein